MQINPNGGKRWIFRYTFEGKPNRLGFGVFPDVSLSIARGKAEKCRQQIAEGIDPAKERKAAKQQAKIKADHLAKGLPMPGSFEEVARKWLDDKAHRVKPGTLIDHKRRQERLVWPYIGTMSLSEIKPGSILQVIQPLIDKQQLNTAHRVRAEIGAVFAMHFGGKRRTYLKLLADFPRGFAVFNGFGYSQTQVV